MMQDFFARQEQARRHTTMLLLMFAIAVILIVFTFYLAITTGLFIIQIFNSAQFGLIIHDFWDRDRFLWVIGIACVLIASGSIYRTRYLKQGGGAAVAEMMGGKRIPVATDELLLSRLLHVVEEMVIASGLPVPPVYLLQQGGINAFAAGFGVRDAVIAVTSGAVELLSRDELQGVIAHEFSHILNGDIGLKMRLMGLLFGITLISDSGIVLMTARVSAHQVNAKRGVHPAVMVIGFLIFMVGTVGAVFADMIKRAVSRQREFLADAAAVQFTRNPAGIAGALKVIGGYKAGSCVNHAATQQISHFFFCNAMKAWRNKSWWATHPPLLERIRRLEPGFKNDFESVDVSGRSKQVRENALHACSPLATDITVEAGANVLVASIGNPGIEALHRARTLLDRIPVRLSHFVRDPFTARAVVYALLLDRNSAIRKCQFDLLQRQADASVFRDMLDIQPEVSRLDVSLRLPLLEIVLPTLKTLSKAQFDTFRRCVDLLIQADAKVGLFEYMMQRMLLRHLYPSFLLTKPIPVYFDEAKEVVGDVAVLVVLLIDRGSHARPESVYATAMHMFSTGPEPAMPKLRENPIPTLDAALKRVERASPAIKKQLLKACAYSVLADSKTVATEIELLRTIVDALDLPMPQLCFDG